MKTSEAKEKLLLYRGPIDDADPQFCEALACAHRGPEHASCARDCIRSGLPVGIKAEDGKVYLLTGKDAHVNTELADYAAKIVTIRGKETARAGFAQIQVEEIRKF